MTAPWPGSIYRSDTSIRSKLCCSHAPHSEVWAYGSRVSGGGYEASDLDLGLRNPMNPAAGSPELVELKEAFIESNLPIRVDVMDWSRIPESFHREIERAHVVLQAGG